jgi:hypothetical protein
VPCHPFPTPQIALVERPLEGSVFLEGPAGCGKTTTGVERLLYLMAQGRRADSSCCSSPSARWLAVLRRLRIRRAGRWGCGRLTVGGLAQRMLGLFWPWQLSGGLRPIGRRSS